MDKCLSHPVGHRVINRLGVSATPAESCGIDPRRNGGHDGEAEPVNSLTER
jgi:hypothetical protein